MTDTIKLDPEQLVELGVHVAAHLSERLREAPRRPDGQLVDSRTLAAMLGLSRKWVYEHSAELGVKRTGPHGRLRFDPEIARAALPGVAAAERPSTSQNRGPRRREGHVGRVLQVRS